MKPIDIVRDIAFPRAMGTTGEQEAIEIIENRLQSCGIPFHKEDFEYSNVISIIMKSMFAIAILLLLAFNLIKNLNPWWTLSLILILIVPMVIFGKRLMDFNIPKWGKIKKGQNIIGQIDAEIPVYKEVLLCAHYDSISSRLPSRLYKITFIILGIDILFSGLSILIASIGELFGLEVYKIVILDNITVITSIVAIPLIVFLLLNKKENKSPGACDNATGIAVLISVAHKLKQANQIENTNVKLLFTGAEEYGLWGSRAYLNDHLEDLKSIKGQFYLINLDMVGSEIAYLGKAGLVSKKPLNKVLNTLIKEISARLKIETREFSSMIGSSSDFAPFLKKRLEACTFTSMKDKQIHSLNDTVEKIDSEKLEDAVMLIEQLIYEIDNRKLRGI